MVSWLDRATSEHRGFELGELVVEPRGTGWEVRGPRAGAAETCELDASNLESIRQRVLCDDGGRYRPLSGAPSLPGGLQFTAADAVELRAAIEVIYPLATHHIAAESEGQLRMTTLDNVLERQSGRYAKAAKLSDRGRAIATEVVCGQCVRTPIWVDFDASIGRVRNDEATGSSPGGPIPCPEACSIMVSFCREAAQWEAELPASVPVDPAVGFAAFETPGNALRELWLAAVATGEVQDMEVGSGIPADSRH